MAASQEIQIHRIAMDEIEIPIVGLTPLVTHKWSEKALGMMRDKQAQKVTKKKEAKDPVAECEAATYRLPDGRAGVPASAFKSAIVQGARNFDSLTMTAVKQAVYVVGLGADQLVPIIGEAEMWESPVRIAMGTTDLRYRPRFWPWAATLTVRFNSAVLSKESVANLVHAGGMAGVGEWRPSSPKSHTGSYGMFETVVSE